jgi:dTDP-4-dehydrorhamnose reductase
MLGKCVLDFFKLKDFQVITIGSRWPEKQFKKSILSEMNVECIINCIGAIPERDTNFSINYDIPLWLDSLPDNVTRKVIYPGTDCKKEESEYASSKHVAINKLSRESKKTKVINCSIIGFNDRPYGLLQWLLDSKSNIVRGYTSFFWNGITCLEWSKICYSIIDDWRNYPTITIPFSECLSKYELLSIIIKVFDLNKTIVRDNTVRADRCLIGNFKTKDIEEQLVELNQYSTYTKE